MATKTAIIAIFVASPCAPEAVFVLCGAHEEKKWHRNWQFFSIPIPRQALFGLHNFFSGIEIIVFPCFRCHLPFLNVSEPADPDPVLRKVLFVRKIQEMTAKAPPPRCAASTALKNRRGLLDDPPAVCARCILCPVYFVPGILCTRCITFC